MSTIGDPVRVRRIQRPEPAPVITAPLYVPADTPVKDPVREPVLVPSR